MLKERFRAQGGSKTEAKSNRRKHRLISNAKSTRKDAILTSFVEGNEGSMESGDRGFGRALTDGVGSGRPRIVTDSFGTKSCQAVRPSRESGRAVAVNVRHVDDGSGQKNCKARSVIVRGEVELSVKG